MNIRNDAKDNVGKNDLLKIIDDKYSTFSKGQKRISDYLRKHYDQAPFLTAAKLGEKVGVSESTVVRFATELGYSGYPELQNILKELIKSKLTSVQRLEVSQNRIDEKDIINSVLTSDIQKLKITMNEMDRSNFEDIVNVLLDARRVYILGVRSAAPLASFFAFYLNLILDNVKLVNTNSFSEMFEQTIGVKTGDVAFSISFPRYSRRTIKATEFMRKEGALTIALTDSKYSPLAKVADMRLIARSDMASFADSLVAPLSLINALIVALGMKKKQHVYNTLNKLEKIWDEYGVYEKSDQVKSKDKETDKIDEN